MSTNLSGPPAIHRSPGTTPPTSSKRRQKAHHHSSLGSALRPSNVEQRLPNATSGTPSTSSEARPCSSSPVIRSDRRAAFLTHGPTGPRAGYGTAPLRWLDTGPSPARELPNGTRQQLSKILELARWSPKGDPSGVRRELAALPEVLLESSGARDASVSSEQKYIPFGCCTKSRAGSVRPRLGAVLEGERPSLPARLASLIFDDVSWRRLRPVMTHDKRLSLNMN